VETAKKILSQKRSDSGKIYSLHEPEVYCVSKGKEHKKYEFGAKASVVVGKNGGVILGAYSLPENDYDARIGTNARASRAGGWLPASSGDRRQGFSRFIALGGNRGGHTREGEEERQCLRET
jgi:hypothetical protein